MRFDLGGHPAQARFEAPSGSRVRPGRRESSWPEGELSGLAAFGVRYCCWVRLRSQPRNRAVVDVHRPQTGLEPS